MRSVKIPSRAMLIALGIAVLGPDVGTLFYGGFLSDAIATLVTLAS